MATGGGDMPAEMRNLAPGLYDFTTAGKTLHVAVTDTDDGRLTVLLDATAAEARVYRFGIALFSLWLACVTATVFVARAVAAFAVEPIVAATRSIARSAPGAAFAVSDRSDEAGVLMETFGRFRDRVDDMLAREREFAANLDHEIRTPLTTIRTDAELLGLETTLASAQQARLDRIIAAVDEISATTESTLSHSAGRFADVETVETGLLDAACQTLADRAAACRLRIVNAVPAGEQIQVDRQALLTVVRNIVRNAVEHAAPATLTVSGNSRALTFDDDGPGIDPAVLDHVFDRHRHGHTDVQGTARRGLGLAIARRLCELQGWRLQVHSPGATGRGTSFSLALVATPSASA